MAGRGAKAWLTAVGAIPIDVVAVIVVEAMPACFSTFVPIGVISARVSAKCSCETRLAVRATSILVTTVAVPTVPTLFRAVQPVLPCWTGVVT